ncbi:MAG: hypothetical protein ACOX5Z_08725 [Desulfobulbus sp.]|jgi:hypothetical protein
MKKILLLLTILVLAALPGHAGDRIPATPVMTLYRFNGPLDIPYYDKDAFRRRGTAAPQAGSLAQGTSVLPCVMMSGGAPLTDADGVPYVGFEVVVDSRTATPAATARFKQLVRERKELLVRDHQCGPGVRHVLDVRNLYAMNKAPSFDPPRRNGTSSAATPPVGRLDQIVRAFHNAPACAMVNKDLLDRRHKLDRAWDGFIRDHAGQWPEREMQRARHLDYTMRTALFEGHLGRGCSAYGACERNIIALSIRNRAREACRAAQGCRSQGDFQGVASAVSQYNIWDAFLTQISGLTSCYLRDDLVVGDTDATRQARRLQAMYNQSVGDVERILFGDDRDLQSLFPGNALAALKQLRHYYHAPAMGKCFPHRDRIEYISGAIARRGDQVALIANTRIEVGRKTAGGYLFRDVEIQEEPDRDVIRTLDTYSGFVVDGRRISLLPASRCTAYGLRPGCRFEQIGRYRKTPFWVNEGTPLAVTCRVADQGEQCQNAPRPGTVQVGGICDVEMQPFSGVR